MPGAVPAQQPPAPLPHPLWVMLPFALAYFASYLFRTVNAVVYPELARDLGLAADRIGLLTSAYLLAFAAAQLPVGVALDRYGPRKVQTPLLLTAALGAALFAQAGDMTQLVLARALIGFGVGGSLMAAIKAASLWLPPDRLSLATAAMMAVGGMGAMASASPTHALLQYTGWRGAFGLLGGFTFAVALFIWVRVPNPPQNSGQHRAQSTSLRAMAASVRQLYSSWSFWRLSLYCLLAHAVYLAVQGLWLGPWLRDVAGLSATATAHTLLAGAAAMVAGALFFGWLTDYLRRFQVQPLLVCGAGVTAFVLVQVLMLLGGPGLSPLAISVAFSFFGTSSALNYAILAHSVPAHLTGRVSTCFNLLVFLLAFAVQWGMGAILNLWPASAGPEGNQHPLAAYHTAWAIAIALQVPGLLLWLSFKPWQRLAPQPQPV